MSARTLIALPVLALVPLTVLAAPAPQQGNLQTLVTGVVETASQKDLPALWKRAVELRDASALGEKGELDLALDGWLARPTELSPQAALLVSASRLLGPDADVSRIAEVLVPLIDGADAQVAAAASQLLADKSFRTLAPGKRDQMASQMIERAEDAALPPPVRLDFAKGAYRLGGGKERLKVNKVLRGFLDSQDPELRIQGALAMAELDAVVVEGKLRDILESLSKLPDERGVLARSYLEREELRREKDRRSTEQLGRVRESLPLEIEEFLTVLRLIKTTHLEGSAVKQEDLVEAAINGMLRYMDNHSSLMPSKEYAKFFGELEGEYGGIGAYVNEDPVDHLFTIVKPIYSGPAYHTGLMTDDKIVRIDDWPTLNQEVDEIIKHLKGKPNTPVNLYIWRHGMDPSLIERPDESMKVTVVREQVRIPPGTYQMLPGGIGLLQLDEFSQVAMEEARKWIPEMLDLGMKALVLDLRFNGGGLLTEAKRVAELFLPRGSEVVTTVGKADDSDQMRRETLVTTTSKTILPPDMPLVVLVGGGTASAAEIVSGALQDHHRATLVGKTTYGKGSVQQLIQIMPTLEDQWDDENGNRMRDPWEKITVDHDGDGEMDYSPRVKLTIAKYLLPSGRSIHRELDREGHVISEGGVTPDVEVNNDLIEGWRVVEQRRIRDQVREFVDETYAANRDLYANLAVNDQKRTDLYPGFDQLLGRLETTLGPDDVRRVLRREVRRRVEDDRGAAFPAGDFVEDSQVQKAIEVALDALGEKPSDVKDFQLVFDLPAGVPPSRVALARDEERDLSRALREARGGGKQLTNEQVDRLIEILGTIDLKKN